MTKYQSSFERIDRDSKIRFVLTKLIDARRPIQIELPQSSQTFQTMLLGLDELTASLHMDSLKPELESLPGSQTPLLAKSQLNGVELTFRSLITHTVHEENAHYYHISIPNQINYLQRRTDFRLPLSKAFAPKVTFVTQDHKRMEGSAKNVSVGGLRAVFKNPPMCYWQDGDRISSCIVQLTANTHINSSLEIRNSHYDRKEKILTIGARFVGLSKLQEHSIARYVAASERELRRKGVA